MNYLNEKKITTISELKKKEKSVKHKYYNKRRNFVTETRF